MYKDMVYANPDIFEISRYDFAIKMAKKYNYDGNDDSMKIIGITGTKGKTTTSYMIKNILEEAGKKVAICGTLGAYINGCHIEERNTTPPADELYKLIDLAKSSGCEYFVMEVSSQGIKQCRVAGIKFHYGVFTNLSTDHIGGFEHKDMEEYILCKSLLFAMCEKAIINYDEQIRNRITAFKDNNIYYYGVRDNCKETEKQEKQCLLLGEITGQEALTISFDVKGPDYRGHIDFPLLGRFNVSNSLAAMAVTMLEGVKFSTAKKSLEKFKIKGREEAIELKSGATLIIDYAHNAASMESILKDVRTYGFNKVICVFGCGGNRSADRRISMGNVSGSYADVSIITEDNSRMEDVHKIISDIEKGVLKSKGKYVIIPDRRKAIEYSMAMAGKKDVILLLGKGHETYQDSGGVKRPFDERSIVADFDK